MEITRRVLDLFVVSVLVDGTSGMICRTIAEGRMWRESFQVKMLNGKELTMFYFSDGLIL